MKKGILALTVLCGVGVDTAGASRGFLVSKGNLQPQKVAKTLAKVEETWRTQVNDFVDCNANSGAACDSFSDAFSHSCNVVVKAVLQASDGDRSVVTSYMADVCGQPELQAQTQHERCQLFGASITEGGDGSGSPVDATRACQGFWTKMAGPVATTSVGAAAVVHAATTAVVTPQPTAAPESKVVAATKFKTEKTIDAEEDSVDEEVSTAEASADEDLAAATSLIAKVRSDADLNGNPTSDDVSDSSDTPADNVTTAKASQMALITEQVGGMSTEAAMVDLQVSSATESAEVEETAAKKAVRGWALDKAVAEAGVKFVRDVQGANSESEHTDLRAASAEIAVDQDQADATKLINEAKAAVHSVPKPGKPNKTAPVFLAEEQHGVDVEDSKAKPTPGDASNATNSKAPIAAAILEKVRDLDADDAQVVLEVASALAGGKS